MDDNAFRTRIEQLKASGEYSRQKALARYRDDPAALRALREDLGRRNAYLAEQGLPPLEDDFPELPEV